MLSLEPSPSSKNRNAFWVTIRVTVRMSLDASPYSKNWTVSKDRNLLGVEMSLADLLEFSDIRLLKGYSFGSGLGPGLGLGLGSGFRVQG